MKPAKCHTPLSLNVISRFKASQFPQQSHPARPKPTTFRMGLNGTLVWLFLFTVTCPVVPVSAFGADSGTALFEQLFGFSPDEASSMFFHVETKRGIVLHDALPAIRDREIIYLDIMALAQTANFAIRRDGERISGWIRQPERLFDLNIPAHTVRIREEYSSIAENDFLIRENRIFVNWKRLNDWFQLKADIDSQSQRMLLSGSPVPAESRIIREQDRARLQNSRNQQNTEAPKDWVDGEHQLISMPSLSTSISGTYRDNKDSDAQFTSRTQNIVQADFLGSHAKLVSVANSETGLSDLRVSFSRAEFDDSFPYTRLSLGDVTGYSTINGSPAAQGLGFGISNRPLQTPDVFGEETFEGDGPPGWEVELYRNGQFIDFQYVSDNGRYRFEDVNLNGGVNDMRIVFYGPEGQVQTQEKTLIANAGRPSKGNLWYAFSAVDDNRTLLGYNESLLEDNTDDETGDSHPVYAANIIYGISNNLSAHLSLSHTTNDDGRYGFTGVGIRHSIASVPYALDLTQGHEFANGQALKFSSRLPFFNRSVSVNHNEYFSFAGLTNEEGDAYLERETDIFFSLPHATLNDWQSRSWRLQNTFNIDRQETTDQKTEIALAPNLSLSTPYGTLSNTFRLTWQQSDNGSASRNGEGSLSYQNRWEDLTLRSRLSYDVTPEQSFNNADFRLSKSINENWNLTASVTQGLKAERTTGFSMGVLTKNSHSDLGSSLTMNSSGDLSLSFSLSFGLQDDASEGGVTMRRPEGLSSGAVLARVFSDLNRNGVYDPGEPGLPNVVVQTLSRQATTNNDGLAHLTSLGVNHPIKIFLDQNTLESPFYLNADNQWKVRLKTGILLPLDIPLVPTGEITGQIMLKGRYADNSPMQRPLQGIQLELLNEASDDVREAVSIFDGSFLFASVPLGKYRLRVKTPETQVYGQLVTCADPEKALVIEKQGQLLTIPEFTCSFVDSTFRPLNPANGKGPRSGPGKSQPLDDRQLIPEEIRDWW
ncbi:hypothetical protein [Aestuariispira insulae]|uniref:Outer membrane usher protein FimD/PapC n=1 Tax=Aestuariispira insulae TaxID=1461337 RepID=A0A3D9HGH9_9PROT|nr:hypothetical protein [Aestuariispira insulae]RED48570.1 hypothetical protein DFP90_10773 [Aestuariispira insulae]